MATLRAKYLWDGKLVAELKKRCPENRLETMGI